VLDTFGLQFFELLGAMAPKATSRRPAAAKAKATNVGKGAGKGDKGKGKRIASPRWARGALDKGKGKGKGKSTAEIAQGQGQGQGQGHLPCLCLASTSRFVARRPAIAVMKQWLLAKVLDFCSPKACGQLGMSCRQARELAEGDMKYYRDFEDVLDDPSSRVCTVCHAPIGAMEESGCKLCVNTGTCRDCQFHILAMPHGVQDLGPGWTEPLGLRVGDTVCLQCGWHPSCSALQSRNYFRFISACKLIDER
jgi:hypothetical protein